MTKQVGILILSHFLHFRSQPVSSSLSVSNRHLPISHFISGHEDSLKTFFNIPKCFRSRYPTGALDWGCRSECSREFENSSGWNEEKWRRIEPGGHRYRKGIFESYTKIREPVAVVSKTPWIFVGHAYMFSRFYMLDRFQISFAFYIPWIFSIAEEEPERSYVLPSVPAYGISSL